MLVAFVVRVGEFSSSGARHKARQPLARRVNRSARVAVPRTVVVKVTSVLKYLPAAPQSTLHTASSGERKREERKKRGERRQQQQQPQKNESGSTSESKSKSQRRKGNDLPPNTRDIAAPREQRDAALRQDAEGRIIIPRQDNVATGDVRAPEIPRPRVGADWSSIEHKSRTLFDLPLNQIRNRTCRRLIAYAKRFHTDLTTAQRYAAKSVVYAIFHKRTSKFYIGETQYDGRKRLREHWDARLVTKGGVSTLSAHMGRFSASCVDGWSEYRFFPVHVHVEESNRKRFEANTISELRRGAFSGKCLNNPSLVLGKRLRHRPNSPPQGQPAVVSTVQIRTRYHGAAAHLEKLSDRNRFAELAKMRDSTLCALKRIVPSSASFGRQLRQVASDRQRQRARDKHDGLRFVVTFASRKMQAVNVRQELQRNLSRWPYDRKLLDNLRVVYKPLAPKNFRNHVDASLNAFDLPTTCDCSCVDEKYKVGGHVLTADPSVFLPMLDERHQGPIKWLIEEAGPKFRTDLGHLRVLASLRNDIESFLNTVEVGLKDTTTVSPDAKKEWSDSVFNSFASCLFSKSSSVQSPVGRLNISDVMAKVHERFVLAPADKNAQNTAIWCKALYRQSIESHLSPPVFVEVTSSVTYDDVISDHRAFAKSYGKPAFDTLPYVYKLAKIHKLEQNPDRPPSRPIAGKSVKNKPGDPSENRGVNSLSAVHQQTAKMLQSVMDLLILRDRRSKVRYCWFVRTAQEVIDTICSDSTIEEFETSDFSDMYTNIPLEDLVKELHGAIDLATDELARLFSVSPNDACKVLRFTPMGKWEQSTKYSPSHWSMDALKQVVEKLAWATFVRVGDRLFRQVRGVGMGQESSPPMAQLYLHMKERRWINKLIASAGPAHVERCYNNFRSFVRLMDDNMFPIKRSDREFGALPEQDDYGGLEFKVTGEGQRVKFIGLEFVTERRGTPPNFVHEVNVKAFDKQKSFAFTLIRYPSWHSNVPRHIVTGSITGLLCRFFTHTSKTSDFITQAVDGLKNLHRLRDYPSHVVKSGIVKFLQRNIDQHQFAAVRDALFAAVETNSVAAPLPVDPGAGHRASQPSGASQQPIRQSPAAEQDRSATPLVVEFSLPRSEDQDSATPRAPAQSKSCKSRKVVLQQRRTIMTRAAVKAQLHVLTEALVERARTSERMKRSSSRPASSTDGTSQRMPQIDYSQVERSVERALRELLPQFAQPAGVCSQASPVAPPVSDALHKTVQHLCDTLANQQQQQQQLVHDVLAQREASPQHDNALALVAAVRQEAQSVMDRAMSVVTAVADRPAQPDFTVLVRHMCEVMASAQQQYAQLLEQHRASNATSGRLIELVENRLSQPLPLPPPPAPQPLQIELRHAQPHIVELPSQVVTLQQQVVQTAPSSDALLARFMEMMSHNFEYQRRMLESTQQAMLAIADTSRDNSKLLLDGALASQQLLLTNFTTSVDKVMQLNNQPLTQLCPALLQCLEGLAATREVLSSVSRPLLLPGPSNGVTVVEVRDKSVSPGPPASTVSQPPVRQTSDAAPSAVVPKAPEGKRSRSPGPDVKAHRSEQSVAADRRDHDRSSSPEPVDPNASQ